MKRAFRKLAWLLLFILALPQTAWSSRCYNVFLKESQGSKSLWDPKGKIVAYQKTGGLRILGAAIGARKELVEVEILGRNLSEIQKETVASYIWEKGYEVKGDSVIVIDRQFRLDDDVSKYLNGDVIHGWTALDRVVIEHSSIDSTPREVHGLRALDIHGRTLAESFSHDGNSSHMDHSTTVDYDFAKVYSRLNEKNLWAQVATLESTHSHPDFEFIFLKLKKGAVYPQSQPDIMAGILIAQTVPRNVIFKVSAVVPNGYTYSRFFYNGVDITASIQNRFSQYTQQIALGR
jgi:hypothetical protein